MYSHSLFITDGHPLVVGSFGGLTDLSDAPLSQVRDCCDVVEIRLDILCSCGWQEGERPWRHLDLLPLLFTARCRSEGGVMELPALRRKKMYEAVVDEAALVDIELSSLTDLADTVRLCQNKNVPWLASYHRFDAMPLPGELINLRDQARGAGAALFKVAATVGSDGDIDVLEDFQRASHGFPVSTMGMGPLAAVSRVRCALAGSILNYGYIGTAPTAPGQWPAGQLREAIHDGLQGKS
jgi:3-dehydroquinate dehydratase type I